MKTIYVTLAITALNTLIMILDAIPGNQGESILRGIVKALSAFIGSDGGVSK